MPFSPSASSGAHALDLIQGLSADLGYGWQSGLDASLTNSTSIIESEWTAGSILWDGTVIDLPDGTIEHDAGDQDNPRWDALAVTDSGGTVQAIKGTPMPVATDDDGNTYPGEQAWTPSPSDQITRDMVVFAIVWIPAGASNNDDLTNTSAGGVAEPVVDRRVEVPGQEEQITRGATITSSGWYRIASVGPVVEDPDTEADDIQANALFSIRDTQQQLHSENTFWASLFFDQNPTLSLQNSSYYTGTHGAITDIRIVHPNDTYDGGAVEVNVQLQGQSSVSVEYSLTHNHTQQGWTPEPWAAGDVPSGWNTTALDLSLDPIQAVAADGQNDLFTMQRDGTVVAETMQRRQTAMVARLNNDVSIGTSGTTRIPWDSFEGDWPDAWNSNNEFVAPFDGWYDVDVALRWPDPPDGMRADVLIDATGYTAQTTRTHSSTSSVRSMTGDALVEIDAGDSIWVGVQHDAGSTQTVAGWPSETRCQIVYVG